MRYFLLILFLSPFFSLNAQLVWTEPFFPRQNQAVTVYYTTTEGTGGLANCQCDIYIHTGVLLKGKNGWQNVPTQWGTANPAWRMSPVPGESNRYSYSIGPNISAFYGLSATDTVTALAFVFRNADGSLEGKDVGGQDIFYPVYPTDLPLTARFLRPAGAGNVFQLGQTLSIWGVASESADLSIFENGDLVAQGTGISITYDLDIANAGDQEIKIVADNGLETSESVFNYIVPENLTPEELPAGAQLGINLSGDTSMILALYAPGKENVFAIGSFSDWKPEAQYQMRPTPDGTTWWTQVDDLQSGQNITFQYLVDGAIRIADPYSTLVLDQGNDPFIPEVTYPDMPPYPVGLTTGMVTLVQPGAPQYDWAIENFERPDPARLTVYELLIRDFIERHDYTTLIDTLDYLQRLGVNAIELMPINEFENNNSWGYNPSYHLALDKYYGTINECKRFIDSCHARGIAVILDVVYNHAFGQSPLVQLYFEGGKPAPDNPWLNPDARHPFNVGYDFNHQSPATRYFVKRAMEYWIREFKVDGFRFDLSKGFTQVNNPDNVGAWGAFDASRIAILKDYADFIWDIEPGFYVILEHFAENAEERALADYGMMLWANIHGAYTQTGKGLPGSLSDVSYKFRSFSQPRLIHYMESHDEERIMYKNLTFGNTSNPQHNIRDLSVALRRAEQVAAFYFPIPGPKMIWQFGELGYDYSINHCPNGTIDPGCRVSNKPVRWDYYDDWRRKRLYDVYAALIDLKTSHEVFATRDFSLSLGGAMKRIHLNHESNMVTVLGNFGLTSGEMNPHFQQTGTWYEFFTREELEVTDVNQSITMQAGEYRLYSTVEFPDHGLAVSTGRDPLQTGEGLRVYPNPSREGFWFVLEREKLSDVGLEVMTLTGQRIYSTVTTAGPGAQSIYWHGNAGDGRPAGPGIYIYRVTTGNREYTGKIAVP
jgi:hypothetical protein